MFEKTIKALNLVRSKIFGRIPTKFIQPIPKVATRTKNPFLLQQSTHLQQRLWRACDQSDNLLCSAMRFGSNGTLYGTGLNPASRWSITDDTISIWIGDDDEYKFLNSGIEDPDVLVLQGSSVTNLKNKLFLKRRKWGADEEIFGSQTSVHFSAWIKNNGWQIGAHTYGIPKVYAHGSERLIIGKYCSIGESVTVILTYHRSDFVTTYPFSTFGRYWPGIVPHEISDHRGKGDVVVGNDVWIGHGTVLAAGVEIGDGAVIGACSVVTKDVPPYAIVAGNPATIIRYRFSGEVIRRLLEIKWWDWTEDRVEIFLPFMLSEDMESFLREVSESLD